MTNEIFEDIWKIMKEIEFVFKSEIANDLLCNICKKIMIKASQAQCGCRYCSECIQSYLGGESKFCPVKSKYCQVKLINFEKDIIVDHAVNIRITEIIVNCPRRNCDFQDELSAIESHIRTCNKNPISCPYFEFGCNKFEVLSNEINDHLYVDSYQHNKLLLDFINNLRNEIESMKNKMIELETENRFSCMRMNETSRNETVNKSEIEKLNQKIDSLTNENLSLKIEIEKISQSIVDIKELINKSSHSITKIGDSTQGFPIRVNEIDNLCNAAPITHLDIDDESEIGNETNLGEFDWKIDKLSQQPINSWIYSRPFYSHKFGYKMCLSVKFCGNSVNVYFHLLRGEHDSQLSWPFKSSVIIGAIDQPNGHICTSRTIKYDFCPNSAAWVRPTTERNSEIWCFTFLGVILVNDKLRFRCKVSC